MDGSAHLSESLTLCASATAHHHLQAIYSTSKPWHPRRRDRTRCTGTWQQLCCCCCCCLASAGTASHRVSATGSSNTVVLPSPSYSSATTRFWRQVMAGSLSTSYMILTCNKPFLKLPISLGLPPTTSGRWSYGETVEMSKLSHQRGIRECEHGGCFVGAVQGNPRSKGTSRAMIRCPDSCLGA